MNLPTLLTAQLSIIRAGPHSTFPPLSLGTSRSVLGPALSLRLPWTSPAFGASPLLVPEPGVPLVVLSARA